jgi:hypothetical protein
MSASFFFGYGSLVNKKTHSYEQAHTATAHGWRRAWRYTDLRQVAFLTAVPDPSCSINGLIAHVPNDDWGALDLREAAYARLPATEQIQHKAPGVADIAIYAIDAANMREPDRRHPVLLSYLDVVVQGYLEEFGPDGAAHFFDTTIGWDAPILNDRDQPRYPRAQALEVGQRDVVDSALAKLGCTILTDLPAV